MTESRATLSDEYIRRTVEAALAEDAAADDVTTAILVAPDLEGKAVIIARQAGVVAGLPIAAAVFRAVDPAFDVFRPLVNEGGRVAAGDVLAEVSDLVSTILRAERVALNFLQRLSGIATATARLVDAVSGLPVRILDTRKTTPGLRPLEKYAVRLGGGGNHRWGLADGILVKDNHWRAVRTAGMDMTSAVALLREEVPEMRVEVEVTSLDEVREALTAGVDVLLLDNMGPEEMRQAVEMARGQALTEASGGITLENVRAVAETGVDFISVGAITHSAPALDISLELEAGPPA